MHESLQKSRSLSPGSDRSFGLIMAVASFVFGCLPWLSGHEPRLVLLAMAGAFLVVALLFPRLLRPLNILWFRFGLLLSKVMTPVIMGILYFGVVTPISLLGRLSGKSFLPLKPDTLEASYWTSRDAVDPASAKHLF
jgi:hypothetical protein